MQRLRWGTHQASITASGFGLVALLSVTLSVLPATGSSYHSTNAAYTASSVALYLALPLSMFGLLELMRAGEGPWRLMIPATIWVIVGFAGGWPPLAGDKHTAIRAMAFLFFVSGVGLWALATLRWARFPRWVGWLLVAQTASLTFERIAGARMPEFAGMGIAGWAWAGTMLVLAFVLGRLDVGHSAPENANS